MTLRVVRAAISVCVLVLLFATAAARAQVSSSRIEGMVVDGDGKALPGVKVEASEDATGTKSATTDKSGRYRFIAVRPGEYKVRFNLESYAEVLKYGSVRLGGNLTINAKMFKTAN
jgi:hypothetical protein